MHNLKGQGRGGVVTTPTPPGKSAAGYAWVIFLCWFVTPSYTLAKATNRIEKYQPVSSQDHFDLWYPSSHPKSHFRPFLHIIVILFYFLKLFLLSFDIGMFNIVT